MKLLLYFALAYTCFAHEATVRRYCLGCHNSKNATATIALDQIPLHRHLGKGPQTHL